MRNAAAGGDHGRATGSGLVRLTHPANEPPSPRSRMRQSPPIFRANGEPPAVARSTYAENTTPSRPS